MQIDIIGVPIDLGADRRGVDMGPSAIRYSNLQKKLEELGYNVKDEGNIEVPIAEMCKITSPKLKYIDCIVPMARRVAGKVATTMQAKIFHWSWAATTVYPSAPYVAQRETKRSA